MKAPSIKAPLAPFPATLCTCREPPSRAGKPKTQARPSPAQHQDAAVLHRELRARKDKPRSASVFSTWLLGPSQNSRGSGCFFKAPHEMAPTATAPAQTQELGGPRAHPAPTSEPPTPQILLHLLRMGGKGWPQQRLGPPQRTGAWKALSRRCPER